MMLLKQKKALSLTSNVQRIPLRFANFGKTEKGKLTAISSKNCDCTNGKLKAGLGLKPFYSVDGVWEKLYITDRVRKIFFVRNYYPSLGRFEKVLCYIGNKSSGQYHPEKRTVYPYLALEDACSAVCYKTSDGVEKVAYSGSGGIIYFNPTSTLRVCETSCKPIICTHAKRFFAVKDDYTLLYNSPHDSFDCTASMEDAGEMYFRNGMGTIVALESCGEYLYVFFEYGMIRLYAPGNATDFKAVEIPYSGEKIVGETVGSLGDKILFVTSNGLRCLNTNTRKVTAFCEGLEISPAEDQTDSRHAAFGGKFLIYYNDKKSNGYKTLVVDSSGTDAYLLYNRDGLSSADGIGLCAWQTYFYTYADDGNIPSGESYNFTAKTDFWKDDKKTFRSLIFEGKGEFTLTVESGGRSLEKYITLSERTEVPIGLTGKSFCISFRLRKGAEIQTATAVVERLKGGKYAN